MIAAVGRDHLVLVPGAGGDAGDEQLPHPRRPQGAHGMHAAVPEVPFADDARPPWRWAPTPRTRCRPCRHGCAGGLPAPPTAGGGGPHRRGAGRGRPGSATNGRGRRRRTSSVSRCRPRRRSRPPGGSRLASAGDRSLEQAGRVDPVSWSHRARRAGSVDDHQPHGGGVGPERPDHALVATEHPVGIAVAAGDDQGDVGRVRSRGGGPAADRPSSSGATEGLPGCTMASVVPRSRSGLSRIVVRVRHLLGLRGLIGLGEDAGHGLEWGCRTQSGR